MAGTLYTYPNNFRAYKALIAAQYSGAQVTVAPESDFKFGETNQSADYLAKFPLGKVPAFTSKCGKNLTESNAIAYFLANAQLRGANEWDQAQIWQWASFADSELLPAVATLVFPLLGIMQFQKNQAERARKDVDQLLAVLNKRLTDNTFLVGERVTLADIAVFTTLIQLFENVLEAGDRKNYVAVTRWFNTVLNQPQVKAVVKNFKLCDKALTFDPAKYAAFQAKVAGGAAAPAGGAAAKKEKAPKEKKEAKPAAKKEEEPAEEPDAAELALRGEPESKDPFAALPKGKFDMDDFKRFYSNEDEAKSIPYFWEKFDAENYSIWFGEYKYNEELSQIFMSCNLITGMFQRLDKMRKQAFSSVLLFGENNNSTISGVWVWRGQDLAFKLTPDWQVDYEVYDWKKLDPASQETKDLVKQYFSWSGTDKQGRKFNQGKVFK